MAFSACGALPRAAAMRTLASTKVRVTVAYARSPLRAAISASIWLQSSNGTPDWTIPRRMAQSSRPSSVLGGAGGRETSSGPKTLDSAASSAPWEASGLAAWASRSMVRGLAGTTGARPLHAKPESAAKGASSAFFWSGPNCAKVSAAAFASLASLSSSNVTMACPPTSLPCSRRGNSVHFPLYPAFLWRNLVTGSVEKTGGQAKPPVPRLADCSDCSVGQAVLPVSSSSGPILSRPPAPSSSRSSGIISSPSTRPPRPGWSSSRGSSESQPGESA